MTVISVIYSDIRELLQSCRKEYTTVFTNCVVLVVISKLNVVCEMSLHFGAVHDECSSCNR